MFPWMLRSPKASRPGIIDALRRIESPATRKAMPISPSTFKRFKKTALNSCIQD
jgi:hypothetical protein